ncbi:MAG: hypothetical protein JWN78_1438 [Bacteroidota bacterium]|nr:hypothetical protein [Bacteroidota bacterium]
MFYGGITISNIQKLSSINKCDTNKTLKSGGPLFKG